MGAERHEINLFIMCIFESKLTLCKSSRGLESQKLVLAMFTAGDGVPCRSTAATYARELKEACNTKRRHHPLPLAPIIKALRWSRQEWLAWWRHRPGARWRHPLSPYRYIWKIIVLNFKWSFQLTYIFFMYLLWPRVGNTPSSSGCRVKFEALTCSP